MTRSEQLRIEKMRLIKEILKEANKLAESGHGDIKITCVDKDYQYQWHNYGGVPGIYGGKKS